MSRRSLGTASSAALQLVLIEAEPQTKPARTSVASEPRPKPLQVRDLITWVRQQVKWIMERSGDDTSRELFVYQQSAKLVEEVGELNAELLGRSKLQRSGKVGLWTADSLAGEVADVLICTLILADVTGVDVSEALRKKMAVVDARVAADTPRADTPRLVQI